MTGEKEVILSGEKKSYYQQADSMTKEKSHAINGVDGMTGEEIIIIIKING